MLSLDPMSNKPNIPPKKNMPASQRCPTMLKDKPLPNVPEDTRSHLNEARANENLFGRSKHVIPRSPRDASMCPTASRKKAIGEEV